MTRTPENRGVFCQTIAAEYLTAVAREGRTSATTRVAGAIYLHELSVDPRLTDDERRVMRELRQDYHDLSTRDAGRRAAEAAEALVRAELARE